MYGYCNAPWKILMCQHSPEDAVKDLAVVHAVCGGPRQVPIWPPPPFLLISTLAAGKNVVWACSIWTNPQSTPTPPGITLNQLECCGGFDVLLSSLLYNTVPVTLLLCDEQLHIKWPHQYYYHAPFCASLVNVPGQYHAMGVADITLGREGHHSITIL